MPKCVHRLLKINLVKKHIVIRYENSGTGELKIVVFL
jgi:hypothetical protein